MTIRNFLSLILQKMTHVLLGWDYPTDLATSSEGGLSASLEHRWCPLEGCLVERFAYEQPLSEDYIRIIELLPSAEKDDTIQCNHTSERRQDTENTYDAISYVWGDASNTVDIICCGRLMSITTSLAEALQTIRFKSSGSACRLWADAICINQDSSEEKNHQVKRIGQVYQGARQVFAWLGPDRGDIALECFDLLKERCRYLEGQLELYTHPENILLLDLPIEIRNDSSRSLKLKRLMQCSWFSRVWVIQEAGLAKECHFLWGDQSMSIAELIEFACFCYKNANISRLMGGAELNIEFWCVVFTCIYRTYNTPGTWRCSKPLIKEIYLRHLDAPGLFVDVLHLGRLLSATDPRDHIYAFLGTPLACSKGNMILEPDYGKEEYDLNLDLTRALLSIRHESPFVLCFAKHSSAEDITRKRPPSWLPQWKKPSTGPMPLYTIGNIGLKQHAGGPVDRLKYDITGVGDTHHLTIHGVIFDTLTKISEVLKSENLDYRQKEWDTEFRTSVSHYIDLLWDSVTSTPETSSTKPLEYGKYHEDFSFALVAGYKNPEPTSPAKHGKIFRAYLRAMRHTRVRTSVDAISKTTSKLASSYAMNTRKYGHCRLAATKRNGFALVPQFAQKGDVACVFLGMATPFILRPAAKQNGAKYYHLVGEAYMHGRMQGELIDELDRGCNTRDNVTLI